jgi:hypothetical protein
MPVPVGNMYAKETIKTNVWKSYFYSEMKPLLLAP